MTLHLPDPDSIVQGLVITLAVGGAARGLGLVSTSGLWAGLSVGGWVSVGLGAPGLAVVGAFFVLASAATRWRYREKHRRGIAEPDGGARDAGRVLAKGSVGAALAVAALFDTFDGSLVIAAFGGAFAAATADTLGTEVGQVLGRRAYSILPPASAKPGTPGAISWAGTLAGLLAATAVAAAAAWAGLAVWWWIAPLALAGILGSFVEAALTPLLRKSPNRDLFANLVTTSSGAAIAALAVGLLRPWVARP